MSDVAFHRIVVGVDVAGAEHALAPGSRRAVDQARWLAKAAGAHVTLLYSAQADERWDDDEENFVAVPGGARPGVASALDAVVQELRSDGIDVDVVLSDESAALAITHRVLEREADLVIVGKRAGTHHDGRRIGSVAARLVHECPCPVWVVMPHIEGVPRVIVVATPLASVGTIAVRTAAAIAERADAALHVVHAVQLTLAVQMEGAEAEATYVKEKTEQALASIREDLGPARDRAEIHIGLTSPTRAVLECERRLEPDLVVIGTVARGGVAGLLIGNTAERLLGSLDSSILAIKPADFVTPVKRG